MAYRTFVDGLSKASRAMLADLSTPVEFRRRDWLLREGDTSDFALLLTCGWVKVVSAASDGTELVLALRGPGDLVGELSAFDGAVRSARVIALGTVRARRLAGPALRDLVIGTPELSLAMIEHLMQRQRHADRKRLETASSNAVQRVAWQLLELAEVHGRSGPGGTVRLELRLTRPELAAAASVSPRQLFRALALLGERGMVSVTGRGRLVIEEPAGLRAMAEESRDREPADEAR